MIGTTDWRPLERTALSYAVRLASHERPHVTQVARSGQVCGPFAGL